MNDEEKILTGVLDRWKAEIEAHRPERVAALFTEDAIFQGLHPYGFTDRAPVPVNLTVVARHDGEDWRLAHYHVSQATV